jgi:YVTN family beta-propeller protein
MSRLDLLRKRFLPLVSTVLIILSIAATPGVRAQTVVATIQVGHSPNGIAVDPITAEVWVANTQDNTVSVINEKTFTVTDTISGLSTAPLGVAVNTKTDRVYVTNNPQTSSATPPGEVTVINDKDHKPIAVVTNIPDPRGVDVNPATNLVYVASTFGSSLALTCNPGVGSVFVINATSNTIIKRITYPFSCPVAVAVDPVTNRIYTSDFGSTVGVIDGSTNTLLTLVNISGNPCLISALPPVFVGVGITVNVVTDKIYAAGVDTDVVNVIDGSSNTVVKQIPVGTSPCGVNVDTAANRIYVANSGTNRNVPPAPSVSVIDGSTDTVIATVPVPSGAVGVAVDDRRHLIFISSGMKLTFPAVCATCTGDTVTVISGA